MSYIDLFLDTKRPLTTPRFRCDDEHWKQLEMIFPEPGFRSYFLGYLVTKLRNELEQHGINSYEDRLNHPQFANFAEFMSNIHFIGNARNADDGRGAGSTCDKAAFSTGDSGDHASLVGWRDKATETKGSAEEARPGAAGPLTRDYLVMRLDEVYHDMQKRSRQLPFEFDHDGQTVHEWLCRQSNDVLLHHYRRWMRAPSTLIEPVKVPVAPITWNNTR